MRILAVTIFSDVAPKRLVDINRRITSETSINIYQTIRRKIPENSHLDKL
jgi:hypothetical protein